MKTFERWAGRIALLCWAVFLIAATFLTTRDTVATWVTTGAALANGAGALGSTITNTSKQVLTDIELNITGWSGAPTVNTVVSLWLCSEVDGTNFEDCDTTNFSPRPPDITFPVRAASAAQRLVRRGILLSAGDFKVLVKNETGVSINSGWTVKGRPTTYVSQ